MYKYSNNKKITILRRKQYMGMKKEQEQKQNGKTNILYL